MYLKAAALIILTLVWLYGMLLRRMQLRSADRKIPENVADVYDPETYARWREYNREICRLGMLESTAGFLVDFLLLLTNAYAAFARLFPGDRFWQLAAVLLLSALTGLLMLPFSYRRTMGIEEKYGFNRSTAGTFWLDQVKTFLISLVLMIGIACLLMGVHLALGDWLILAFALVMALFALIVSFLYPFFSRIFNKFTPLPEGELRSSLTALLEKHGYRVRELQVMDASRRSTKSNAYFTGFGRMKTIVLYDTLIQAMTPEEICAVFSHELGHGLHRDTLKNQALSFLQMAILAVLAWLTLRSDALFLPFGFSGVNYGFALLLIMSVEFALVSPLFGLLTNLLSRRAEYRADAQAVEEGYGEALISALRTLARENFSDLSPAPLLVKLEYSHPPLSRRIDAIRAAIDRRN
jgi:STE24 endopeptidase